MRSFSRFASARSLPCTARNRRACRSAMTLPLPESRPLQPSTSEDISHAECVLEHVHRARQRLQRAHMPFVLRHVVRPVLDGAQRRHLVAQPQQRVLADSPAPSRADTGTRSAAGRTHRRCAGNARAPCSAFCPIVNGAGGNTSSAEAPPAAAILAMRAASRLPSAQMPCTSGSLSPISSCVMSSTRRCSSNDAGRDLGRMRVDGQRRDAFGAADIADVAAEGALVDREVVVERQQDRRNDAVRQVARVARHVALLVRRLP